MHSSSRNDANQYQSTLHFAVDKHSTITDPSNLDSGAISKPEVAFKKTAGFRKVNRKENLLISVQL